MKKELQLHVEQLQIEYNLFKKGLMQENVGSSAQLIRELDKWWEVISKEVSKEIAKILGFGKVTVPIEKSVQLEIPLNINEEDESED